MSSKETVEQTEVWDGPGEILRRAREAKGLDVPAVAVMLHLAEKKLKALEADDFDLLPESVYVRGYLKNYARFLGEPIAPILDAYARLNPATRSDEQRLLDSHVAEDISSSHDVVRIVSILVVVVVIALPIFWWWDYLELAADKIVGKAVQINGAGTQTADASKKGAGLSEFIQPSPSVSTGTVAEGASPTRDDNNEPKTKTLNLQITQDQTDAATKDGTAASPGGMTIQIPAKPQLAEVVEPPAKPTQAAVVVAPAPVTKETVFEFIESSWVKVRDNNDQVVLIGEYKKGETKKLSGERAPYKVVLGNSTAVQVKIDGKPADLGRFSTGGVSRFTIKDGKIENP
jgi:cytoskeleton protein RodZ